MARSHFTGLILVALLFAGAVTASVRGQTGSPAELETENTPDAATQLLERIYETLDQHHFSPPTRQEFALVAARVARWLGDIPMDRGMKQEVEAMPDAGSISRWLHQEVAAAMEKSRSDRLTADALATAVLRKFDPAASLVSAREARVREQLRENQYVGIGIQVAWQNDQVVIQQAFPGGAARRAGMRTGDAILQVDEDSMEGHNLGQVIEALRGTAGSPVSVVVQNEDESSPRKLDMIRNVIPISSVTGTAQDEISGSWEYVSKRQPDTGLIALTGVVGSSASELAEAATKLRAAGINRAVLDLRAVHQADLHFAHLAADTLCGAGQFATVIDADAQRQELETLGDSPFEGIDLAVLVPQTADGPVFALIAALQRRDGTTLIGNVVRTNLAVTGSFEMPEESGSVEGLTWAMMDPQSISLRQTEKSADDAHEHEMTDYAETAGAAAAIVADIREENREKQLDAAHKWLQSRDQD